MNIRSLIVALPLVVFSHSLVAMAAVSGNVRSVLTARCDGENFQCGFLSITDTPYRELVEAARDIARRMYGLRYGRGR